MLSILVCLLQLSVFDLLDLPLDEFQLLSLTPGFICHATKKATDTKEGGKTSFIKKIAYKGLLS